MLITKLFSTLFSRSYCTVSLRPILVNPLLNQIDTQNMAPHFRENKQKRSYHGVQQHNKFKNNRFGGGAGGQSMNPKVLKEIDWSDTSKLTEIVKDLYCESDITKNRNLKEVKSFLETNQINTKGNQLPKPVLTFDEIQFPDYIKKEIQRQQFENPTAIQAQAWPIVLKGQNLVSIAKTGSGKTLGFLLPAIMHINNQKASTYNARKGPMVLVLAPTRELAQQIQQVASQFGATSYIRNTCLFGGSSRYAQERELRRGCEIVIATPGRLIDFLESGVISLEQVTYLVLDEADRMLDMGFEPQIRKILSQVRPDRQTLMWSATWPKEVHNLAEDFIGNYSMINIGSMELTANHNIKQHVEVIEDYKKDQRLVELLNELKDEHGNIRKTLIFGGTKRRCEKITSHLNRVGFRCVVMHGDKSQNERETALKKFRNDYAPILIATDVCARGLDVEGIDTVINYDFCQGIEDYVHRIGRTGRSTNLGQSF
ncbi:ATP-dependent RNA helicase p62-like, partial [Culicoides brevitarsis]